MAVTRNDVARAAGVSSAVVSYVLNDGPRPVSAAARQRVLEAIDQLGYRRDIVARSMRTRTTDSIGLVLPDIRIPYFAVMTQRITEVARKSGLSVVVATSNGSVAIEREHLAELAGRRVDGVILMSVEPLQELSWAGAFGMPVLVVDRPIVAVESSAAATEHLVSHGATRLARIAGHEGSSVTERRDLGWFRVIESHGLSKVAEIVRAGYSQDEGYAAARQLLDRDDPPRGVVVDGPLHASAFLRAAADLGVRIPDDVLVIGNEIGDDARFSVPRISSVDSPIDAIAAESVDRLKAASPEDGLLSLGGSVFTLHERESCGHPAGD
ncbi:LacI family DNA-binding transcriptional regulator [Microbacterium sp. B2969]|uniref:LacI family DNA-binding transcriptional regulator n=1 Tax=Microbacterium alkaliflavum TaxID=3248839 RepID=A0ABW7QDP2_9MICO